MCRDYKIGGYHRVSLGDVFHSRYRVVKKLGWGHFSTVWLVRDMKAPATTFLAMKIVKSARRYTEAALDEIQLLAAVRDSAPDALGYNRVVMLVDHFMHEGPHGAHVCMVTEVLGCSLLSLIKQYEFAPLPKALLKRILRQTIEGLHYLRSSCQIIHTDIKPENILVRLNDDTVCSLGLEAERRLDKVCLCAKFGVSFSLRLNTVAILCCERIATSPWFLA
jgi:serine/threonine protein kinase